MVKTYKSVKETSLIEILRVERDKPRKRETQNLVGELSQANQSKTRLEIEINDCLIQNMAY